LKRLREKGVQMRGRYEQQHDGCAAGGAGLTTDATVLDVQRDGGAGQDAKLQRGLDVGDQFMRCRIVCRQFGQAWQYRLEVELAEHEGVGRRSAHGRNRSAIDFGSKGADCFANVQLAVLAADKKS
jgi:hypothetical protein